MQALAATAALALLFAWTTWNRFVFLAADPYPLGIDGAYYAVQVRELLEHGRLNYPAAPLAFWLLAPFAAALGPVTGVKLGAAALGAAGVFPAYVLARHLGTSRPAALIAACLVATSNSSAFLAAEFVKQGVGATFALATLAALAGRHWKSAALLAVATVLTHKSAALLVLIAALPLVPWKASLAAIVAVALLGVLMPERFLGSDDLDTLARTFSRHADLALPALVTSRGPLVFGHEAWIALVVAALAVALDRSHLTVGLALLAVLVAIPWLDVRDVQGAGFRLRLMAFLPLAPLAAVVVERVRPAAPLLAGALLLFRPQHLDEGVSHTHPALVQASRALAGNVPPGAIVVTQDRKVAFLARYYAGVPMRLRPEGHVDYRLLPGFWIRPGLRAALLAEPASFRGLHAFSEDGMVLVAEPTWQRLVAALPAGERDFYARWPTT